MKKYNIKSELFEYIEARVKELESDALELVQEYDNTEEADARSAAAKELKNLQHHFLNKAVELIISE